MGKLFVTARESVRRWASKGRQTWTNELREMVPPVVDSGNDLLFLTSLHFISVVNSQGAL